MEILQESVLSCIGDFMRTGWQEAIQGALGYESRAFSLYRQ
jgi:hypothetical protein